MQPPHHRIGSEEPVHLLGLRLPLRREAGDQRRHVSGTKHTTTVATAINQLVRQVSSRAQRPLRTHRRIAREWTRTVPSGSFSVGSLSVPVSASRSSRDPLRRNGSGLPWPAITFSYSIPLSCSAS